MTNVEALKGVYVSLGGELTDTYPSIANGAPVSDYVIIPDVISAISVKATGAIELPTTTTADNGKLLTVVDGVWNKANAPAELPAVSATDNGDVLTVVDGEWNKAAAPTELPAVTADDNGDVLTVANGVWSKAAPSGGSKVYTITNETASVYTLEVTQGTVWNEVVTNSNPDVYIKLPSKNAFFRPFVNLNGEYLFACITDLNSSAKTITITEFVLVNNASSFNVVPHSHTISYT